MDSPYRRSEFQRETQEKITFNITFHIDGDDQSGTAKKMLAETVQVGMEQSLRHLLERAPRAKFYRLNDHGKWDDQGTGNVTIDYFERSEEMDLFVIGEYDIEPLLLHHISQDDIYKHEDKVIHWRDPEYSTELALNFQETIGCSYIWDQICSVQRNLHLNSLNTSLPRIGGSTTESNDTNSNFSFIDVEEDNGNDEQEARHSRDGSYQKVTLEWIFVITNFILELPSTVFDQLSSLHKPEYTLIAMLTSFIAMLVCVIELLYKDIVGLGCAIPQFVVTTINYSFSHHHVDNPIKISVWPIIFAFGLLCSKLLENPNRTPSSRSSP